MHIGPRRQLLLDPSRESLCPEDVACELYSVYQALNVGLGAQVVGVNQRLVERVLTSQANPAPRHWAHHSRQNADRVRVALAYDDVEWHMHECDLQIGPHPTWLGLQEERS